MNNSASDSAWNGLLAAVAVGGLVYWLGFVAFPPAPNWETRHSFALLTYLWPKLSMFMPYLHYQIEPIWNAFEYRAWTLYGFVAFSFLVGAFYESPRLRAERKRGKHLSGNRRVEGAEAVNLIAERLDNERELNPATRDFGIEILPGIKTSVDRETKAEIIVGSIGSGKTQLFNRRLREIVKRGDRALIHDFKGDFTSWLPSFALLNPADDRSLVWDVARDIRTSEEADSFSAALIEPSSDPMWSNAARMIFTGWIVYLQTTKPGLWDWADLARISTIEFKQLQEIILQYYPRARRLIEHENVTTAGIMINLSAFLNILHTLAKAWANPPPSRLISMRDWLLNDDHPVRLIVFQNAANLSAMAAAWIAAILRYSVDICRSPLVEDTNIDSIKQRRLWFMLDEFAMLGSDEGKRSARMNMIADLNALSRSKGIRIVIGCQDWSQVIASIGKERADSWQSMVGSLWIMQNKGPAAITLSNLIGMAETEYTLRSVNRSNSRDSAQERPEIRKAAAITPSELTARLGPIVLAPRGLGWIPAKIRRVLKIGSAKTIACVPIGYGEIAPIVEFPIIRPNHVRPGLVPADWNDVVLPPRNEEDDL